MPDIETLKWLGQVGAWALVFAAFCWLVREVVTKQSVTIGTLAENLKILSTNILSLQNRIEFWNKDSETAHSFQRQEHKEMLDKISAVK
jgi:hypothetical protein